MEREKYVVMFLCANLHKCLYVFRARVCMCVCVCLDIYIYLCVWV